jgi:lipopolysaccharide export system protein LptA
MKRFLQIIAIIFMPSFAFAQLDLNEVIKPNEGEPINITSDSLVIKNNENISIFEKNVHVKQGDMNLKADQMTVYSETNPTTKKSTFKRITAAGNVDFKSADKTAKSDHADYDVKGGILILRDNVHLVDGDSSLQGREFTYNVKTGMSKISNSTISDSGGKVKATVGDTGEAKPVQSGGRVKAVFTPGEDVKKFSMPMDAFSGVRGKEKKDPNAPDADKKDSDKPVEKKE